jgi:predicted short-subunit dehydrogenase-like oxidoreductase (DUF2520 family)
MTTSPEIALIGLGNLGWNLASRLHECGYNVAQVVAADTEPHQSFLKKIGAERLDSPRDLSPGVGLIFLCTPDDVLVSLANEIKHQATLVHCSGSTPLFDRENTGVFYAFQTFTKYFPVPWEGIPIFIESENESIAQQLTSIALKMSGNARQATTAQRKAIHIAGVFGANFVNHIIYQAQTVLDEAKLPFEVLEPLLIETLRKAFEHGPAGSQTGPAKRGDHQLIAKHLAYLNTRPELQQIYALMSASIEQQYKK